jgi:hypothetical protein
MKKIFLLTIFIFLSILCYSQRLDESYYRGGFADVMFGKTQVTLDDQSRVDIVTDTFAIEVEFAERWSEGIGQSLYYAEKLHKKAGVLLIIEGIKDDKYIKRLMTVALKYDITVWTINYHTDKWRKVGIQFLY